MFLLTTIRMLDLVSPCVSLVPPCNRLTTGRHMIVMLMQELALKMESTNSAMLSFVMVSKHPMPESR